MLELREGSLPSLVPGSVAEIPSDVALGPAHVTAAVVPAVLQESTGKIGLSPSEIEAIGVDFPTAMDVEGGKTLAVANLKHPQWEGFLVRDALVTAIGSSRDFSPKVIVVENDGAAGVVGVASELPLEEQDKLIAGFFVGTGLGGGAVLGGRNHFNNKTGGSEPGATQLYFDEGPILFGEQRFVKLRRLEEYVSIVAIERQLEQMAKEGVIPRGDPLFQFSATETKGEWRVRAEKLLGFAVEALRDGHYDHYSLLPFRVQQAALGLHLQTIIQWERPAHVFIGGGVVDRSRVGQEFIDWYVGGLREAAIAAIHQDARKRDGLPEFHVPVDGDYAVAKGMGLLAVRQLDGSLK